jgi:hypothetical protein
MEGSLVAYKVFSNGSVLNASEINDNLMNQSVMVFSNAAARTAALTAPVEGMVAYLEDTNLFTTYNGSAWKNSLGVTGGILQVLSVAKTDTFTTSSSSYQDVTGLSLSITPSSATNKILILGSIGLGVQDGDRADFRLLRDSTPIGVGDLTGINVTGALVTSSVGLVLDTPNTTSAVTYKAQIKSGTPTAVYVNRRGSAATPVTYSSLIAMEVSA